MSPEPEPEKSERKTKGKNIGKERWKAVEDAYEIRGIEPMELSEISGIARRTIIHHMSINGFVCGARMPGRALEPVKAEEALAAWQAMAHAAQLPPPDPWSTWLLQGGRGAGKTRAGAEWLMQQIAATPGGSFALVGATMRDVREVMIDGVSGLRNLPGRPRPRYEATRGRVVFDNDAVAYAFSSQEPERLRGPQFHGAWGDEFCAWYKPTATLEVLRFALRRGDDPRLVLTTTPKPITALRALRAERSCAVTLAPTAVNAAHLSPRFLDTLNDIYANTTLAKQELEGLIVEGDGALWKAKDFAAARGNRPSVFDHVVVAVDPPAGTSSGVGGAACGIIVAARRGSCAYVLADASVRNASPLGWATCVAEAVAHWGAREVIAEANQGGHMVRSVLAGADVRCAIRLVHASEGKRARAEPVAALYEQGRVVHCGAFPALEEEMMALGEAEAEGRLDRADALVWAITGLLVETPPPRARPRITQL